MGVDVVVMETFQELPKPPANCAFVGLHYKGSATPAYAEKLWDTLPGSKAGHVSSEFGLSVGMTRSEYDALVGSKRLPTANLNSITFSGKGQTLFGRVPGLGPVVAAYSLDGTVSSSLF